jgi:hypothetical protein
MWAVLREFDPGDLYDDQPSGDFTPMRALLEIVRRRAYADLVSAYSSHFYLTITPALDYAEADRFDSVLVDYNPRTKGFTLSYSKKRSAPADKVVVHGVDEAAGLVDALVQRC